MTDNKLVAFLRARYDEIERKASRATAGPWRYDPTKHHHVVGTPQFEEAIFAGPTGKDATCIAATGPTDDLQSMADADHIATHHPQYVLADLDAKRRLLAEYEDAVEDEAEDLYDHQRSIAKLVLEDVLALLALPYADHPDYRAEWAPGR